MNRGAEAYQAYMYSYPHKTAYRPLEGIDLAGPLERSFRDVPPDLYIHIPFCGRKCGFCNLFSAAGADDESLSRYTAALCAQFERMGLAGKRFRNITVGGGTPLLLNPADLARLLPLAEGRRWVETSPAGASEEKLAILRNFRTERVSLGVQSLNGDELVRLGRSGDTAALHGALRRIRAAGFPRLNVDLIYGIPGQSVSSLEATLRGVLRYEPEEIFLYPLYIRRGTALYGQKPNGEIRGLYFYGRDLLAAAGYAQRSMRQFAKNPPEDSAGCGLDDMIGLGCGARTYLGNLHFSRPYAADREEALRIIGAYTEDGGNPAPPGGSLHGFILNEDEQRRRFIIKNLFHYRGLSINDYRNYFATDPREDFSLFAELREQGFVEEHPESAAPDVFLRLTETGLSLSDMIGPRFISPAVRARMNAWRPG
ncbi:MAG: STM4012 family radical SAM protein [Treponema sp.]|jgi:oxygen-independent coproporphyrinogen-3 oxidase|nr:STM4012 family radical SAM protein [Treponema sp.]